MAEKLFKVVQLDDGSITVDAPASEFPEKGYFTFYDKSASARGECEPMRRHPRDTARVSGRQERPAILLAMVPGALPGARRSGYARQAAARERAADQACMQRGCRAGERAAAAAVPARE